MKLLREDKLYPHRVRGEGHFAALFEKQGEGEEITLRAPKGNLTRQTEKAYREFEKDFFNNDKKDDLYEVNGTLYALPGGVFDWKGLNVLRVGVKLGEVINSRFEPAHALALSCKAEECKRVVELDISDSRLDKFLSGETIEYDVKNGWCLVCVDKYPIGLGKAVNGTVKNHIPKALRKVGK
jgi:NOL1/NOP2/fmu family ribosome biogenesis protein